MNQNAKCSALIEWGACGVRLKEHQGLDHAFQARWQHKDHIIDTDSHSYCGWPMWMISESISSRGNAVKSSVRKNKVCRSCLKVYLYISVRDSFLSENSLRKVV